MNCKLNYFLKSIIGIIVILSSILYIVVTPEMEESSSILRTVPYHSAVPYIGDDYDTVYGQDDTSNYNVLAVYDGTVTAYGPDCVGCSGVTASGYKVAERVSGVLTSITTTYNDSEFGEVRVLAAANSLFPYGSILRITGNRIDGEIIGIVLDTGGAMRNAWAQGNVLVDVLFESEKDQAVYDFGRQNVTFEVLRYGR